MVVDYVITVPTETTAPVTLESVRDGVKSAGPEALSQTVADKLGAASADYAPTVLAVSEPVATPGSTTSASPQASWRPLLLHRRPFQMQMWDGPMSNTFAP